MIIGFIGLFVGLVRIILVFVFVLCLVGVRVISFMSELQFFWICVALVFFGYCIYKLWCLSSPEGDEF